MCMCVCVCVCVCMLIKVQSACMGHIIILCVAVDFHIPLNFCGSSSPSGTEQTYACWF